MSIVEIQKELEYWPDQKIQEEIMSPTGAANGQTYLVVLEAERRTNERQAYENQMAQQEQPQMTVAEESAMELGGGIMDVDPNLMQNQMMAQQMPQQMPQQMQQQMPQGQPIAMYGGGAIRYQEGEDVELDESGWQYGPYGNKIVGRGGWLYDPTSVVDNALLARDSRALREYNKQIMPDVEVAFDVEFEDGYVEEDVQIPIGVNFFWPDL